MTDSPNEQPESFDLNSDDVAARKRADLKRLFPEVFNEDKIDLDQLRRVMGDWVDEGSERFGLTWPGKAACMRVIQAPATGALRPDRDESVNFDESENVFIEGDNLEVLKLLQKSYFGKVKMIYIDPPYNTGGEFIYPDSYAENLDTYLAYTGQADDEGRRFSTNTDSSGRFHSRWLNMMYPRLYLARNLLRDDGVIFISIDDNEVSNLRKLCESIFGAENFVGQIVWKKKYIGGKHAKHLVDLHEYVLVYAKEIEALPEILMDRPQAELTKFSQEDDYLTERGKYYTRPLKSNLGRRDTLVYPIEMPDGTEIKTQWMVSRTTFDELVEDGRIVFIQKRDGAFNVHRKYYANDGGGKVKVPTLIEEVSNADGKVDLKRIFNIDEGREIPFDNPKPVGLLKYLLEPIIGNDDIVLDFFAGSGTTGHAIAELANEGCIYGRYILVQLPEPVDDDSPASQLGYKNLAEISRDRLRKALKGLGLPKSYGLRAFSLSRSAFETWDVKSDQNEADLLSEIEANAINLREATDEDILFEILMKDGFELTTKVAEEAIAGIKVYSVADGALLICLERNLTKEIIDALADLAEEKDAARVVCLDAGFQGNDQLKTNAVQTFKSRLGHGEDGSMFRTV